MHLNDHTDYGLRALIMLGVASPRRLSAREIADAYDISFTHVQKVVQNLESHGFVRTHRGRGGGVTIARSPDEVTVGDVVRALEPHMNLVGCFGDHGRCVLDGGCALKGALRRAKGAFLAELDDVTLADVIARSPHASRLEPVSITVPAR